MKKIVIYPGRFQPMLPHHQEVYSKLQAQFPGAEVYVATSNKVEGSKSPFSFEEKKEIITQMHGIPEENIILAANPYLIDSYMKEFDQKNTMVIFAVGGKDEDRFPMKNIDDSTGLNMSLRGETRPTYYQMINTLEQHPALPMSDRGYIYLAPTVAGRGEVASASAFRKAFTSVEDTEKRKEIFQKYMGEFNENIFNLFKDKLIGEKMSEQLDIMKFLAGMLNEAPPVNFDADVDTGMTNDDDDEYATKPGYEQDSMITQLGKIIDSDEVSQDADAMKIKKFTPVTQVKTDDGQSVDVSPAEAKALKQMMDMLSSARMGEEQSAREKFLDAIQTSKGLKNMIDFAYDKKIVQQSESFVAPEMDLNDVREDYGIVDEGRLKDIIIDAMQMSEEEFDAEYKGMWDWEELNKTYNEEHPDYVPSDAGEPSQEEMEKGYKDESAPFGEPSQEDELHDRLITAYENGEEDLAEVMGLSLEELGDEIDEYGREHGLHSDDDRDEIVLGVIEDTVHNADFKDHGEPDYEMEEIKKLAGLV